MVDPFAAVPTLGGEQRKPRPHVARALPGTDDGRWAAVRVDGKVVWFASGPLEADDVYSLEGEVVPGMVQHVRKVGFFRGPFEVAVIWSDGSYSSNATGLGAAMHGRTAGEFTDDPETVEVGVGRDGDLLPVWQDGRGPSSTLRFVPVEQVPRIVAYVAGLPADAVRWEWET